MPQAETPSLWKWDSMAQSYALKTGIIFQMSKDGTEVTPDPETRY